MKQIIALIFISGLLINKSFAQQPLIPISDSTPIENEGLRMGYTILNNSEKEVGSKGNFSRYNIQFYITNITNQAKIILYKQGFNLFGNDVSPDLVKFICSNATGARLTAKEAILQAKPCSVLASVEDKDISTGKTITNKRRVQIGYWVKAGETISTKAIVIVPLNTLPDMKVAYNTSNTMGTVFMQNGFNPNNNSFNNNLQVFNKIKNFSTDNYLNNERGILSCTSIRPDQWSADWQIIPVNGTKYFTIKNRWKENYLSIENGSLFSINNQSTNAMWLIEAVGITNTFTIKNAANNNFLILQNGNIQTANIFGEQPYAKWIIE